MQHSGLWGSRRPGLVWTAAARGDAAPLPLGPLVCALWCVGAHQTASRRVTISVASKARLYCHIFSQEKLKQRPRSQSRDPAPTAAAALGATATMLAQRPAGFSLRRLERCSRARRGAWTLVSTTQRQLLVLGGCLHKLDARQEFSALRRGREDVSSDGEAPRRRRLLCATLLAALVAAPTRPAAAATAGLDDGPSTDVVEGAQHLVDLGVQALEVQLSEAPGRGAPVAEKLSEQRQRFGECRRPPLSSRARGEPVRVVRAPALCCHTVCDSPHPSPRQASSTCRASLRSRSSTASLSVASR